MTNDNPMRRQRRKLPSKTSVAPFPELIAEIVDHARAGDNVSDHVLIGPIVRGDGSGMTAANYFIITTGDGATARFDCVGADDRETVEQMRNSVLVCLIERRPIVIHDFDDELRMAEMTSTLWPSDKVTRIINRLIAERAQWEADGIDRFRD